MDAVSGGTIFIIAVVVVALILLGILLTFVPVMLWISALAAGVRISIFTLIGMRLRRVTPSRVVNPLIKAHKAGLNVTTNQLESHYLAGGNVDRVVNALIAAHRANIERLVGGAGEETVVARVGEGVVSTIGSSDSHSKVLENPDLISQTVLSKGLDAGTAFEILSIDIADVDIGKNIGAELQTEQAEADKKIAQAKAEERRAMAVASEQEMKAKVVEMRAKVVEAEAEVPLAMAEALKSGNIGVMDYMNFKNISADTDMRGSIGKMTGEKKDEK